MTESRPTMVVLLVIFSLLVPSDGGSILDGLRGHLHFTLAGPNKSPGGTRIVGPKLVFPHFLLGGHRGGSFFTRLPSIILKHPHHHHPAPAPPLHHHHPVAVASHPQAVMHHPAIIATHHVAKPILVAPPLIAPPTIVQAKPLRANLVYVPLAVLNGLAPPGSIFVHHDDDIWGSGAVAKIPLIGEKRLVIPVKAIAAPVNQEEHIEGKHEDEEEEGAHTHVHLEVSAHDDAGHYER